MILFCDVQGTCGTCQRNLPFVPCFSKSATNSTSSVPSSGQASAAFDSTTSPGLKYIREIHHEKSHSHHLEILACNSGQQI